MTFAGLDSLATATQKTNELFEGIEKDLGWEGEHSTAYQAVRAVTQTLRDRLTVDEAAQFAAQLPTFIRGIYYEGWVPSKVPIKMDREKFISNVQEKFVPETEHQIATIISTVFTNLAKYISSGELSNIKAMLPKDVAQLLTL